MNKKLKRVLVEIQKTEEKIADWQGHLEELNAYKEQLENQEILKSIRSMQLDSWSLMDILDKIQAGDILFPYGCRKEGQEEEPKADIQDGGSGEQKEAAEESAGIEEEDHGHVPQEGKEETVL